MEILVENLPASRIVAFPTEEDLLQYLYAHPCTRNVGRTIRQKSIRGQVIVLLADYATPEEVNQADRNAVLTEEIWKKQYLKTKPQMPQTHGYAWEVYMRKQALKQGYDAAETHQFLAIMRKEKFGIITPTYPKAERINPRQEI